MYIIYKCILNQCFRMAAIHQAALQGNTDCINLLMNNGAHADIQDNKGKISSTRRPSNAFAAATAAVVFMLRF